MFAAPGVGPATLEGVKLGDEGAQITTDTGEIYLKDTSGVCNPLYVGDDAIGGIRLKTRLGGIIVETATLNDCEVGGGWLCLLARHRAQLPLTRVARLADPCRGRRVAHPHF